jgi:H+/Cl- antiporter ClcA
VGTPQQPQLSGPEYLRLIGLGAAIGIPAALVAALFLALVHEVEDWLWHDLPSHLGESSPPWYLVVGLPLVGALIVVIARRFLPGDGGHQPLHGLNMDPTPLAAAPGIALAALGTLAFGAVLGPEMPVIALGSVVGVAATRLVRVGDRGEHVVSLAGSCSAISALFGGPLVAGVLLMEGAVGLGAMVIPILLPGLVAAAIGYVIFVGFGSWGGLNAPGLVVPDLPPYTGVHVFDLLIAGIVGVASALVIILVRRLATEVDVNGLKRLGMPALLLTGGLAVGLLAELASLLGANSQDVLFSGQAAVPDEVSASSTKIVLILLVAKAVAYAVSLGCGFRGGPVFPAIFLGVALASFPVVWFDVSPTLAVSVGAAAGMAAGTRLLLAPVLFSALLVGGAGLDATPAAVLAAAAAWVTMSALQPQPPPAAQPSS